jgi:hypothetical protein
MDMGGLFSAIFYCKFMLGRCLILKYVGGEISLVPLQIDHKPYVSAFPNNK